MGFVASMTSPPHYSQYGVDSEDSGTFVYNIYIIQYVTLGNTICVQVDSHKYNMVYIGVPCDPPLERKREVHLPKFL